jgi:hypothetical protein
MGDLAVRLRGVGVFGVVLAVCLLMGVTAAGAETLVVLNCEDMAAVDEFAGDVAAAGGLVRHSFPPHVVIAEVSAEVQGALVHDPRVELVATGYVAPETIPAAYGRLARDAVSAWNQVYVLAPAVVDLDASAPGMPLVGDALPRPDAPWEWPEGAQGAPAPPGAASWQTSEYLMGSTIISLIFVESNGTIDTQTENWTAAEETNVVAETLAATNWWAATYPYSAAPVTFTWTVNYGRQTGYEPISRPQTDQGLWLAQVMTGLGYTCTSSTYFNAVQTYANDLRNNSIRDWGFAVFVVDSSVDADGLFTDNYFAYAYIGGPFMVMTYDNDNWGIANMDRVTSHEMGHIYGAGDEYCQVGYSCCSASAYYGYLNIQNTNCNTGVTCIMNSNSWAVCSVSQQQLGWRDGDVDGIPDILDVAPTAPLTAYTPDPTEDTTPTYTGTASVGFYPNQRNVGWDVTLNRVANVEYRVDGGTWQNATASDGTFDGGTEGFTFTTAALSLGTHTVEARATDTTGNVTGSPYPSDTVTIQAGHALTVTASADPTTVASAGTTTLSASASDSQGHGVASWSWDDGGAGGAFSPSASDQNPTYTAAANETGLDVAVTLTAEATCDGGSPLTESDSVVVTVESEPVSQVAASDLPTAMRWEEVAAASVEFENIGGVTWTDAAEDQLRAAEGVDRWGLVTAPLGADVAPAESYAFGFDVTAPPLTTVAYSPPVTPTSEGTMSYLECAWEMARGDAPLAGETASEQTMINRFSDIQTGVYANDWAAFWIEELAGRVPMVVQGYPNGTYRGANQVDRGAMAVYIQRTLKLATAPYQAKFTDVASDFWAALEIEALVDAGIVQGFDNSTYRPALIVNRETMACYVARALVGGIVLPSGPATATFSDVPTDSWAYDCVECAVAAGVVQGYPNGTYRPTLPVDRGQMAVFVWRGFVRPTATAVVLGGPAVTRVDPDAAGYDGWSSLASGAASDPGYAYVVVDALRLGSGLLYPDAPSGTWDVKFELRQASDPEAEATGDYTETVQVSASELATAKAGAESTGVPYYWVSWDLPNGLTADDYVLVVSVGDGSGGMQEVDRRPAFTIAP